MSMLEIQRKTLNDFGNSQPAFKPFGQLTGNTKDDIKLGNLIAGDGLIDGIKNKYISHMFKLPAPAVGLYYQHMPIFKVPCNGFITKGDLYCYDSLVPGGSFTSATTANKDYGLTAFTYYNNFSHNICRKYRFAHIKSIIFFPLIFVFSFSFWISFIKYNTIYIIFYSSFI